MRVNSHSPINFNSILSATTARTALAWRERVHYPTQSHIGVRDAVKVNCSPELAAFKGIARRGAWLVSPAVRCLAAGAYD